MSLAPDAPESPVPDDGGNLAPGALATVLQVLHECGQLGCVTRVDVGPAGVRVDFGLRGTPAQPQEPVTSDGNTKPPPALTRAQQARQAFPTALFPRGTK